jgi:hypothetical protein
MSQKLDLKDGRVSITVVESKASKTILTMPSTNLVFPRWLPISITNWVAAKEHHIAEKLRSLGIVYAKACQAPDQIAPSNACNGQDTHSLSLNFQAASHVSDHMQTKV